MLFVKKEYILSKEENNYLYQRTLLKEIITDRKMCDRHNRRKKFLILLLGIFSSAIMSCFFCLSDTVPLSSAVQQFTIDCPEFTELPQTESPAEQNIFENTLAVRDPVCKRNVSRRQFKIFYSVNAAIFRSVSVGIFIIKVPERYILRDFNYISLQLESGLFIRDGPVTDVNLFS